MYFNCVLNYYPSSNATKETTEKYLYHKIPKISFLIISFYLTIIILFCIDFSVIGVQQLFLYMSAQQQDQQVTYKYLFTITPLEIKSNSKLKSSNSKAILIKLGNKTAKCTQMNTPLELEIDVLYSRTLQKYCPIKGIIKIYDVSEDGTEIISCVGGFQTEQLLNQGKNSVVIEKELGASKLKMDINIANKSEKRTDDRMGIIPRQNSSKEISNSRQKYLLSKRSPNQKPPTPSSTATAPVPSLKTSYSSSQVSMNANEPRRNQLISQGYVMKAVEIPYKNTSSNINKSLEKINQALNFKQRFEQTPISTRANEVLGRAETQSLKQQLTDEKRKTALVQEKLNKASIKLNSYRTALNGLQNDAKINIQVFNRVITELDLKDGKPQTQLNDTAKTIAVKFKGSQIQRTFKDLIEIASKRIKQFAPLPDLQAQSSDHNRGLQQLQQLRKQVGILKKLTMQKDKKICSLEKAQQGMEQTIHHLKQTNKHLSQENSYLRQKNDQIQLSLYHKENALQGLRKQIDKYAQDITQLQNRLYNCGLQNEELRQEVDNCTETIEQYREKYGDLKNVKNRAIEMQIKECIRWIDQQDRDLQMSEMEDTMQSEHHKEGDDSLSSVIRNLEIQKVPIEEMSVIRDELMRILKKIDNMMSK